MSEAKFAIHESTDGQFYFNLHATNGQVLATSERYTSRSGARNGIGAVRDNASVDERYERRTSSAKEPYFVLKAANGQVLVTSEMYSSPSARDQGIAVVKRVAKEAVEH